MGEEYAQDKLPSRECERVRGEPRDTGTQSAHRTIERLSGLEQRYVKHISTVWRTGLSTKLSTMTAL
jgi:hypothetical protein